MSDNNYKSYANEDGLVIAGLLVDAPEPERYDDILKLSHVTNSTFSNVTVIAYGARENALDINNRSSVYFDNTHLMGGNQCPLVVKGGSKACFNQLILSPDFKAEYDIELGGWSDQSMARSRLELNSCAHIDKKPIRIVCGWFSLPKCKDTEYKILFWRSLGYHLYNLAKWCVRAFSLR